METEKSSAESVKEETHVREVRCSKCGRALKYPYERIMGENVAVLCVFCYQDLLFPNLHDYHTEMFPSKNLSTPYML
jgi:hypothetical protein